MERIEKGKREGARGERGGGDKLMRMCACEHVTAETEEGKPMEKYARVSKCQLFHFLKAFF